MSEALEAINAANGWNMSGLGILVVFASLSILAIIISQLHVVLSFWDKRKTPRIPGGAAEGRGTLSVSDSSRGNSGPPMITLEEHAAPQPLACQENVHEIAAVWAPLIERLGEPFELADLYQMAKENDLPHPHLSITWMRWENILSSDENRLFTFNHEREEA